MALHHPDLPGSPVTDMESQSRTTPPIQQTNGALEQHADRDVEKQQAAIDEAGLDDNDEQLNTIDHDEPLKPKDADFEYPPIKKAVVIMLSIYLCVFLVALDRTIIGTAIPKITDEFDSFDDVGWYGSAYMITTAGFQLFYGKVYTYYSPKWVYLCAILLFEVGSAVCGAAPSSVAFIIGRAIAGVGCAGIFSGAMVIVMNVLPLEKRPLWMGLNGAMFGIASVAGPLLGGVFTTDVTWRWCFYINLPIGAVTAGVVLLVLNIDRPMTAAGKSLKQKIMQLDPLGTACFLPGIICLLLALQWGGSKYDWSNGRIIALFILFAVLIITFIALQIFRDDDYVTVPTRVITNRSIAAGFWFTFCIGAALSVAVYYLPIYFQAIKGVDAVQSGIRSIPMVLALVVAVIVGGILVGRIGYYTPFMIFCSCVSSIGFGLICTFTVDTPHSQWIGYQFLFGFGLGFGMQQSNMAAQTVLSRRDAPAGMALMFFGQSLGGSLFISVAQNVLDNKLISNFETLNLPNFSPDTIVNSGATDLRDLVAAAELPALLKAYNGALVQCFYVGLAMACFSVIGAAAMEWRSVKKGKSGQQAVLKGAAGAATGAPGGPPPIVDGAGASEGMGEEGKENTVGEETGKGEKNGEGKGTVDQAVSEVI